MNNLSTQLPLFYFSGTGNSRYIAELFASLMNARFTSTDSECAAKVPAFLAGIQAVRCVSIEEKTGFDSVISSSVVVGFCYPIYGSLPPRIMREFVLKYADALHGKKLIIFCTQLMFSGDGARVLTDVLPRGSAHNVIYAEHFNMPNSICNAPIFKVTNEEENRTCLEAAHKKMQVVCTNLCSGRIVRRGFNPFSRILGLLQSSTFPPVEQKNRSGIRTDDDCTACGLCTTLCPMRNLSLENGLIRQHNNCTLCYRCVNRCPSRSITVLFHKKPVVQYHGTPDSIL